MSALHGGDEDLVGHPADHIGRTNGGTGEEEGAEEADEELLARTADLPFDEIPPPSQEFEIGATGMLQHLVRGGHTTRLRRCNR